MVGGYALNGSTHGRRGGSEGYTEQYQRMFFFFLSSLVIYVTSGRTAPKSLTGNRFGPLAYHLFVLDRSTIAFLYNITV